MNNHFITSLFDKNSGRIPSPTDIESAIMVDIQNETPPSAIADDTHLVRWIDWDKSETSYQEWKI